MWIATVLATVSSVIAQLVEYIEFPILMQGCMNVTLFVFMAIGLGGYQANIIQLGIDQLRDASTTEIKSFIIWYVWTTLSAGIIISACLNQQYIITRLLLVSTNLTLTFTRYSTDAYHD